MHAWKFDHNALHEGGHVVAALCCGLDVRAVLIKPTGKYTARCELVPSKQSQELCTQ